VQTTCLIAVSKSVNTAVVRACRVPDAFGGAVATGDGPLVIPSQIPGGEQSAVQVRLQLQVQYSILLKKPVARPLNATSNAFPDAIGLGYWTAHVALSQLFQDAH
jgi:hypothetical protein